MYGNIIHRFGGIRPWASLRGRHIILPTVLYFHPLQCSSLENPRDGGAWWAAVYGVAQSQTRLKRLSSSMLYSHLFCCHHWQSPSRTTCFFCVGFLAGCFLTVAVTASFWREQLPKSSGSVFIIDQAVTPLQHDFQSCSRRLDVQCVSLAFLTQQLCKSFYFIFFCWVDSIVCNRTPMHILSAISLCMSIFLFSKLHIFLMVNHHQDK